MIKFFIYSISIMFFMLFFKYLMFPNYKDKGIYLEYKSYKEYTIHESGYNGCNVMEIALTDDGYYGKLGGYGSVRIGENEEYSNCSGKYILYSNDGIDTSSPYFHDSKSELELKIGKYKAKKAEDVIRSMKRRYSIE